MAAQTQALSATARGQQSGSLAASEMVKTASAETGGLSGVTERLRAVGDIVAARHQQSGMPAADVIMWRFGFQAGVGIALGEHLRKLRTAVSIGP